jgi:hypothetical protein
MEIKNRFILGAMIVGIISVYFDFYFYLFNKPEYLINKAASKEVEAKFAYKDYKECKTIGYRDHRCNSFEAIYIEKLGESDEANARLEAEAIRRRHK